jgi:hypothetical protein
VQRDINKEKLALKSYQSIYKKNPTTAEDWANLHRIAYPVSAGGLPDELKSSVNESLYNGTGMASVSGATAPLATDINTLRAGVDSAAANVQKTSQPNEALRILQEAIRAKSGQANQSIGENPLFKQLGVTGMGALSQSIASQGKKLDMDFANFSNIVSQMSGTYKDLATAALNNYQIARDRYKEEADKITQAEKDLLDHQQAIELANLNFQNSLKLKAYEDSHPGINDQLNVQNAGKTIIDGQVVDKYRTDRNNNPTAMTTDAAKTLGLIEGIDYVIGDKFPGNSNLMTAKLLGDPISTTIKALDMAAKDVSKRAFYSQNGNQRWTYTAISDEEWLAKTPEQKKEFIKEMYQKEGGSGSLFDSASNLSPLAKQVYEGTASLDSITPTEATKIKKEIANAGLVLKNLSTNDKTRVDKIVSQFDNEPIVKEYNIIQGNASSLKTLGNSPTDDMARIYTFAKVMDPGSAVKEGEYDTIQEYSQALLQKYGLKSKRIFTNSGFLTEEARKFISETVDNKAKTSSKQYQNVFNEYGRRIDMITDGNGKDYLTNYSGVSNRNQTNNDPLGIR